MDADSGAAEATFRSRAVGYAQVLEHARGRGAKAWSRRTAERALAWAASVEAAAIAGGHDHHGSARRELLRALLASAHTKRRLRAWVRRAYPRLRLSAADFDQDRRRAAQARQAWRQCDQAKVEAELLRRELLASAELRVGWAARLVANKLSPREALRLLRVLCAGVKDLDPASSSSSPSSSSSSCSSSSKTTSVTSPSPTMQSKADFRQWAAATACAGSSTLLPLAGAQAEALLLSLSRAHFRFAMLHLSHLLACARRSHDCFGAAASSAAAAAGVLAFARASPWMRALCSAALALSEEPFAKLLEAKLRQ